MTVTCDTCKTVHPGPPCEREPRTLGATMPEWLRRELRDRCNDMDVTVSDRLRALVLADIEGA